MHSVNVKVDMLFHETYEARPQESRQQAFFGSIITRHAVQKSVALAESWNTREACKTGFGSVFLSDFFDIGEAFWGIK